MFSSFFVVLYTTSDSPVSDDSFTPRLWAYSTSPSAGTLSPSSSNTISPTTISSLDITSSLLFLITLTFKDDNLFNSSNALSVFVS